MLEAAKTVDISVRMDYGTTLIVRSKPHSSANLPPKGHAEIARVVNTMIAIIFVGPVQQTARLAQANRIQIA